MAIQIAYMTQHGIELPSAYIKISSVQGNKEQLNSEYSIYPTKLASDTGKPALDVHYFKCNYDLLFQDNVIKFAYLELKKLPQFINAVDV